MREHSARVLAYAYHRGASRSEAEDLVAEVFLVCWRRLDDVPTSALPWPLGVARKVLANQRRSQRRCDALQTRIEHHVVSSGTGRDNLSAALDPSTDVLGALARLDETDREMLLLVAWDELTQKEAAQVVGCSRATFGVRFRRARTRFLKHLEDIRHLVN